MTNKEKYKQAFDTLSASDNFSLEVDKMSILNRKHKLKTIAAAIAACLIVTAGTGTAYASDLGGIQRKVQLWIHGDQTTATLTINSDGSYTGTYADKDGKNKEFGGGGIAFNQDGSERSLTQEEIMEELNAPDIEYEKDGSVILYYKNQSIDITHKFNKDNICYVKLVDGDDSLYVTVKYNNGYASSPNIFLHGSSISLLFQLKYFILIYGWLSCCPYIFIQKYASEAVIDRFSVAIIYIERIFYNHD